MDVSDASDLKELVDEPQALRLAMRRCWTSEDQYLGLGRDSPVVRCDTFPWVAPAPPRFSENSFAVT